MNVISLDIGGTSIKGAIVNKTGKILRKTITPTQVKKGKLVVLNKILGMISLLSKSIHKISAISISLPGYFDKKDKYTFPGDNLNCLKNINLKKEIKKITKHPIFIENDANCFALAESVYGKYKKYRFLFGLIWGTGLGGGIILDKQIYGGSYNRAGEIGKIKIPIYITKNQKHTYTLEHMCSGKSIIKMYDEDLLPSKILSLKNKKAENIQKIVITGMAWALSNIINTINPDIILIGGGISNTPKSFYNKIKKEMLKFSDKEDIAKTKIEKYTISDDAGILGAAHIAFTNL